MSGRLQIAPVIQRTSVILTVLFAVSAGHASSPDTDIGGPPDADATPDIQAFLRSVPGLDAADRARFAAGRRLFRIVWRTQTFSEATADMVGLGPLFNQRSCAGCHIRNGRGRPPVAGGSGPARGAILRLGALTAGAPMADPQLGTQLQDQAIPGLDREGRIDLSYDEQTGQFGDGTSYSLRDPLYAISGSTRRHTLSLSLRVPPAVFGGGLLEAVAPEPLQAMAGPIDENGDGITGRLAVIDRAEGREIGRFGWKATRASLRDQVIAAAAEDLGLASRERPLGGCTPAQADTIAAYAQDEELGDDAIEQLVTYLRGLGAPARRARRIRRCGMASRSS